MNKKGQEGKMILPEVVKWGIIIALILIALFILYKAFFGGGIQLDFLSNFLRFGGSE